MALGLGREGADRSRHGRRRGRAGVSPPGPRHPGPRARLRNPAARRVHRRSAGEAASLDRTGPSRRRRSQRSRPAPRARLGARPVAVGQRAAFAVGRRIPRWEGHTRPALETLVEATAAHRGDPQRLAADLVAFLTRIGKGFSPSAFGDRLVSEAAAGCARPAKGKFAFVQAMARHIVQTPDHRGVARALRELEALRRANKDFAQVEMDRHAEFWEAIRLVGHADPDEGFAQITHQRTYSRPKPAAKAISTIHKAKGLECEAVIVAVRRENVSRQSGGPMPALCRA
jgi:hypothetical protein